MSPHRTLVEDRITTGLPGMLHVAAARQRDSVAVVDDDGSLTFGELVDHATRAAAVIRCAGAGPDDIVGLYLEPSVGLVTAIWGVLTAGAAYLPLAPEYPDERISHMIRDSGCRIVITSEALRSRLADVLPSGVEVCTVEQLTEHHPEAPPPDRPAAESDLAYVIYTSGTTGLPKGVAIEQHSIVSQLGWLRDRMAIDDRQILLCKTPISFDAAQWEYLASATGARLVIGPAGAHRDPVGLIDRILRHGVTVLQCVPTLLQALVQEDGFPACTSLRQVFSGGEALTRRLAAQLREALPATDLINLYGPTECTINASAFRVREQDLDGATKAMSIGYPVTGTGFHVLDEQRREVAAGQVGELYISGGQLARGYLNRPAETEARFVHLDLGDRSIRSYRTGDLVWRDESGAFHFVGRSDNQVKVRGHRIELDEIRTAIENHNWVRNAAVFVKQDEQADDANLVACVTLNPREAALMDQGNHGSHHVSKRSRLQVRAQLSNPGLRSEEQLRGLEAVALPGRVETPAQRRRAFARKTYRFFEGAEPLTEPALRDLLAWHGPAAVAPRDPAELTGTELGALLRNFGQFTSDERLLPKYGYASPGALYATQLILEVAGVAGLAAGLYYYHPIRHELVRLAPVEDASSGPRLRIHFLGKRSAVESVYRNNVLEVLRIESGHMLGLLDHVLPEYGLAVGDRCPPEAMTVLATEDDHYLGGYDVVPAGHGHRGGPVDVYLQVQGAVQGMDVGQYHYADGQLRRISDDLVLRKHVIAINQAVYERAAIGISMLSRSADRDQGYVDLGRRLQILQMNPYAVGLMSSGYSSESGNDLPSARRLESILRDAGRPTGGSSYFAVGGRISESQIASEGMHEDSVHTQGPAELIKKDIANFLPHYMVPSQLVILDELPRTANGKIDLLALAKSDAVNAVDRERVMLEPRTETERQVLAAWSTVMATEDVSVADDFFEVGGNSLSAVRLVREINRRTGARLPLQIVFSEPTIEGLARRVDAEAGGAGQSASRIVALKPSGRGRPIVCWPGLGGYPMNLKPLAHSLASARPCYGVQAFGINEGEHPYPTVREMAAADIALLKEKQPHGPYTLLGYSFGARVAYEVAGQLEKQGDVVDRLVLVAPGSPRLGVDPEPDTATPYRDPAFVTLLYSVFAGTITGPDVAECVQHTRDKESFLAFLRTRRNDIDVDTARRIIEVVRACYGFQYTFEEMLDQQVSAPITIIKMQGDDYSFLEDAIHVLPRRPTVIELPIDHYSILREPDVHQLAGLVERAMRRNTHSTRPVHDSRRRQMPHVNIKHFPTPISGQQQKVLVAAITDAISDALGCKKEVISIALEPVEESDWTNQVYEPEIAGRSHLLCKKPQY